MDPEETLRQALEELYSLSDVPEAGSALAAIDRLRALADWLEKGGYPPAIYKTVDDRGDTAYYVAE